MTSIQPIITTCTPSTIKVEYNRPLIWAMAHIWKKANSISFSAALKLSWTAYKVNLMQELLHDNVIEFTFLKKDGSIRKATGTLCGEILPKNDNPTGKKASENVITYFDMEANALRSFIRSNFLKIKAVTPFNQYLLTI